MLRDARRCCGTLTWTRREGVLDHVILKFFAPGQRTSLVRSRDTNSLPIGVELLCPSRDGRSPYECVCFDIPYTL